MTTRRAILIAVLLPFVLSGMTYLTAKYGWDLTDNPRIALSELAAFVAFVCSAISGIGVAVATHYRQETQELTDIIFGDAPAERTNIPANLRRQILFRDKYTCLYCHREGAKLTDPDGHSWEIDHLHPISKGGTNHPSNLVAACRSCNREKHNRTAAEYVKYKHWMARQRFDYRPPARD